MKIWAWFPKTARIFFGSIVLLLIISYGFMIYAYHYALSENGSDVLLRHAAQLSFYLLPLIFFLTPVVFIVYLLSLFPRKTRKTYFPTTVCSLLFLIFLCFSTAITGRVSDRMRMDALRKIEKRGSVLVYAVKEYETKYGYPPVSLEKLVPEFLDKVPKTGIGYRPDYGYVTDQEISADYEGNPWVINVFIPTIIRNGVFEFVYLPKQNYLEKGERVGDWVCVYREGCFIATAAFGTPMARQVDILREFRDKYLLTNPVGRQFVACYYQNGPVVADYIEPRLGLRAAVRIALYPLIAFSFLLLKGVLPYLVMFVCCVVLLWMRVSSLRKE